MKNFISPFRDEKIWRILTNLWTLVLLIFLIADFITKGAYESFSPSFSIIYTGVLAFYVGTKEFDRWNDFHEGRHPGELFIITWTTVVLILFVAQIVLGAGYKTSPEMIPDYIMVLSIFAVTQKSKRMHHKKKNSKK
jgi:uncharacterized membrane protein YoaK (UPF0700 family)